MKRRRILISTTNSKKVSEFKNHFSINYGIDVVQILSYNVKDDLTYLKNEYEDDTYKVIAIVSEESNLYKDNKIVKDFKNHEILINKSILKVADTTNDNIVYSTFEASIEGIIDLSKNSNKDTFGWDSIFVSLKTGKSYDEMRNLNLKISARDQVISKWIKHRFHYKERIDLNWNKTNQKNVISFDSSNIILSNPLFNNNILSKHNLDKRLEEVIDNGVFFRSASNRIQKNYWLPGINAGIPLVPKKDSIHEATFQFHDFMHFLVPDLIIGNSNNKKLYIIYRMMSEAFSLVFADMLYIDSLKENGIEYDYSKRHIYPIYEDFKKSDLNLKDLLLANAQYVVLGDDTLYKEFVSADNLERFKTKYKPFFIEDYKWTNKNWINIKKQDLKVWNKDMFSNKKVLMPNTYTINEFENKYKLKNFNSSIEDLFKITFDHYYNIFTIDEKLTKNPIKNSAIRYLVGQSALFSKYLFSDKVKYYYNTIKDIIYTLEDTVTLEEVDNYKNVVSSFIKEMYEDNLISLDDYHTFKEVYPIFKPFYVFYNENEKYYGSLEEISLKILNN